MTLFSDLYEFIQTHRPHGEPAWWTTTPTPQGYRVEIACPCGVTFGRWVLPQDAAEDLLAETLKAGGRKDLTGGEG